MLVLHRPEARNAVGDVMLQQLKFIVENLRYDPVARVLVISSDVPGVFCAGADIKVGDPASIAGNAVKK